MFDQDYVLKNLHVGENITRENKRNLLPVVLGEEGVALARHISALDQEQRKVTDIIREKSSIIRARFPIVGDDRVLSYCSAEIPDDIDEKIDAAERQVTLAKQADAVRKRANPSILEFPKLGDCRSLLGSTIETLSNDAQRLVESHIEKHELRADGERWLQYGHEHAGKETCPFCDQPIRGLDLIKAYQTYFSEEFSALLARCDLAFDKLNAFIESGFEAALQRNSVEFDFWNTVTKPSSKPELSESDAEKIKFSLNRLCAALVQKKLAPLSVVELPGTPFDLEEAFKLLADYNLATIEFIREIDEVRAETATLDVTASERKLANYYALSGRSDEPINQAAIDYLAADERKKEIEKDKAASQRLLRTNAKKSAGDRQAAINVMLSDFGASFRIEGTTANFKGREPNAEFMISIGGHKVPAGEKSDTDPSFNTLLSAGDKTTLALAFFLTHVRSDPLLGEAIVVFDDPFNSQDLNRQFETTSQIRLVAARAKQVLVFSHDPRFLHMIEKDADRSLTTTFQLQCSDEGFGALDKWSSQRELASLYVRRSERIREYASQRILLDPNSDESLHQAIRPFLEDYLRNRFPGRFDESDLLYEMAKEIEHAGLGDPLFPHIENLFELNNFSRGSMHGGESASTSDELQAQCRKVVRIVGDY